MNFLILHDILSVVYVIQCDQKVSVHLMITIQKQEHRDFLITLYDVKWDNGIINDYFKHMEEINVFKIRSCTAHLHFLR